MKRYILIVAAVALATVSCSRHYDVNTPDPQAIGFGTWADVMTKRTGPTDAMFAENDNFNVFGSKVVGTTPSVVFNGDEVTLKSLGSDASSVNDDVWEYTPPRFWDANASGYTFYAIAPAGLVTGVTGDAITTAATTGAFTTDQIVFDGTVATDVLIAKKTPVAPTDFNKVVTLDFQHVGAIIDVKVKKSYTLKEATVKVKALSLENILYKGTYSVASYKDNSVAADENKPVVAIANWSATTDVQSFSTATTVPATIEAYGYSDSSVTSPENPVNGTVSDFFTNFVVMPQTLVAPNGTNPQMIKITYEITTTIGEVTTFTDKTVAFSAFDVKDNKVNTDSAVAGWNPGTHYIYTLTLDVNKIDFTASITNWETTTYGYNNLVN